MNRQPIVQLSNLSWTFREGETRRQVLDHITFDFEPGEFVALLGQSGSGKSTLLNLISGIEKPTTGDVTINGFAITQKTERDRTLFRRDQIGIVFQFFNLIPTLTVLENITLPQELAGVSQRKAAVVARDLLEKVGMADLLIGIWLGEGLIGLVTQTINDFYFVINVRNVSVSAESLLKGLIIGIFAVMLATLPPAIEAMRTVPASTLRRSSLESKITKLMPWLWVAWFGLGSFGVLMLWLPGNNLVVAFVGLFSVLIALALIAPPLTRFVMLRLAPGLGRLLGPIGRMAPRNIVRSLSRTSIAIAALMMAVSLMVGVSISVGSFRQTLANWLEVTLKSDVYVSPPTLTSGRPSGNLPVDAVRNISKWPGVRDAVMARYSSVFAPDWGREVELMAVSGDISDGKRPYRWIDGNKDTLWPRFLAGKGVMLSEPMVSRQHLQMPPRPITLMTDSGPQTFPVLAVFSDYTSDQGVILMDRASYRAHWQDDDVTTMFLFLASGANSGALIDQLQAAFAGREDIVIQSTHSVREASMVIFDRSFTITIALQLVATVVAFIGVLSALMSLELDRAHELGVFRAIGMTTRQLWKLMFIETGLMGGMAGLMALPTGCILAWILVRIINVRSFGWTLQMHFESAHFLRALLVAVVAALAAGMYPAWRLGRMTIRTAIREE